MKKLLGIGLVVLLLVLGLSGMAMAGTDNTIVTFEVQGIEVISVPGTVDLTIITATPGSDPLAVEQSLTYDVTTNKTGSKITGQITAGGDMPADTTLKVNMTAPSGGASQGAQTLISATAAELVTGITEVAESGITIVYTLEALASAGIVDSDTRTVTFTVSEGI